MRPDSWLGRVVMTISRQTPAYRATRLNRLSRLPASDDHMSSVAVALDDDKHVRNGHAHRVPTSRYLVAQPHLRRVSSVTSTLITGSVVALVAVSATLLAPIQASAPPPAVITARPFPGEIVRVGQSPSSPGWSTASSDSAGKRVGFDIDLSNWLGQRLGFTPAPVLVEANKRQDALQRGQVDLVIATYSITDERRQQARFAGPYMITRQGILVRASEKDKYRTPADLNGKTACVGMGSTTAVQIQQTGFQIIMKDTPDQCYQALLAGQVDAIANDQVALLGLQHADPRAYVPIGIVFGQQARYGVALRIDDTDRCEAVTDGLRTLLIDGTWDRFFADNFPGVAAAQYKPDPNQMETC